MSTQIGDSAPISVSMKTSAALKANLEEDLFYDAQEESTDCIDNDGDDSDGYLFATDLDDDKAIPEVQGMSEGVPWTVDSGTSESVANPRHLPDCALVPSPG